MRTRKIWIILTLGFLVGVSVLLYPAFSDYWNSKTQTRAIVNYESVLEHLKPEDYSAIFQAAYDYNDALREVDFPLRDFEQVPGYYDTLKVEGTTIIGYVKIDKIGVELPVYHGTSEQVLNRGVGHLEGTSLPVGGTSTHSVMSAHRGLPTAKLFTDLDRLEMGDTFQIIVLDQILTYQVDQIKIITPREVDDLQIVEGKDYCTLFTCTPYGINTHRLLVRGIRIETIEEKPVIYVSNEAFRIEPLLVTPAVAAPMMFVFLIHLMVKYRDPPRRRKESRIMGRKIISVCMIVWIVLRMPMTVFAQEFDIDRAGSISVTLVAPDGKTSIAGAEFSLYHVATVSLDHKNNVSYTFTDAFKDCGIALDDPELSTKLDAFVKDHSVSAKKMVTNAQGRGVFRNLTPGLYYLKQTNDVEGYVSCKPFAVAVPNQSDGKYIYDIKANPKTETAKFTDITIKKVWDVDDTAKIADYVEVALLRDGSAVKTAVLNEANNWEVTYSDMPESDSYRVVELNVPEGFTAVYTSRKYIFTVTNRFSPEDDPDDPFDPDDPGGPGDPDGPGDPGDVPRPGEGTEYPPLIQTGQLVWPIPVLTMVGLCLITVGTIVLQKTRDDNA